MGIMPADRDKKWQDLFRRFSLPEKTEKLDSKKDDGRIKKEELGIKKKNS